MIKAMPQQGTDWPALKQEMLERGEGDAKWREGKTAVYVFNAGEDVLQVQKEAYTLYMSENGLGPMAFPSLKQMEDEVVGMGLHLLHGPEHAAGNITSGGTDSITMAIKTARDYARVSKGATKGAIHKPNIVIPFSAHPAFDKAASMLCLEVRRIPVSANLLADVPAMEAAMDEQTILLAGSAPSFPYGLIDPIESLGELAQRKKTWLHVDACVGGYIAPFVRMNGADIPAFDFEVEGVSSMSADLHKYGYCAKGASTVLFRDRSLQEHMIFDVDSWPGGRMVTPTLAGTRPGGAISAAWAVMNYLGVEGYKKKHGMVTAAREAVQKGVESMGFVVLGDPKLGILSFAHPDMDAFALTKQMYLRGWVTSLTTQPRALHLMLSPFHIEVVPTYLADLEAAIKQIKSGDKDTFEEARYS